MGFVGGLVLEFLGPKNPEKNPKNPPFWMGFLGDLVFQGF